METQDSKYIDQPKSSVQEVREHNIGVMKPFFKFGLAAMGIIAGALITIVKSIPKPESDDKRVVKP